MKLFPMIRVLLGLLICFIYTSSVWSYDQCIDELLINENKRKDTSYYERLGTINESVSELPSDHIIRIFKKIETLNTDPIYEKLSYKQKDILFDVIALLRGQVTYDKLTSNKHNLESYTNSGYHFYIDKQSFSVNIHTGLPKPNSDLLDYYELDHLAQDTSVLFVVDEFGTERSNHYQNAFQGKRIPIKTLEKYFNTWKKGDIDGVRNVIQENLQHGVSLAPFTDTLRVDGGTILLSVDSLDYGVWGLGRGADTGSPEYFLWYMTLADNKIYYLVERLSIFSDLFYEGRSSEVSTNYNLDKESFDLLFDACVGREHRPLCDSCNQHFIDLIRGNIESEHFSIIRKEFIAKISSFY